MLLELSTVIGTAMPLAAAMVMCKADRQTVRKDKNSQRDKSASKKGKKTSSRSSRSKSKSKKNKSHRTSKSGKSGKSNKSKKRGTDRSKKSSKSSKSSKSQTRENKTVKSALDQMQKAQEAKEIKAKKEAQEEALAQQQQQKSVQKTQEIAVATPPNAEQQQKSGRQPTIEEEVNTIKHTEDVQVKPDRLVYQPIGGMSSINITNNSQDRKAYKIKCSDNALYRCNPVFGFADPGQTVKVDVLRNNGEQKIDKLCVMMAKAKEAQNAREVFARDEIEREMMVIPLMS